MSHSVDMKESLQTLDHDQKSSESTGPSVQCPNDENINSIGAENKKQQLDINSSDSSDSFDCSNASDISSLISGQGWKPPDKSLRWIQSQIVAGVNPRNLLGKLVDEITVNAKLPGPMDDMTLWRIIANIISDPPRRKKLSHINTLDNVVQLLKDSSNIIVLTGAGVSVSCGIPDFRSKDGIYSRLAIDYPNLPDPQAMFDINYFRQDPRPFFKFAKEIYPGMFKPSPCHKFIQLLETKGKLLRNYTQNIDTLEQVAGIRNVVECHGSFATASCTKCKHRVDSDAIRDDIFAQKIPMCNKCNTVDNMDEEFIKSLDLLSPVENETYQQLYDRGIMKPDIVFFGEGLSDDFHEAITRDKNICDLLIVIGSSLKVRPVALIPHSLPAEIPQILINREELMHFEFDVELLGDSDTIIGQICNLLGPDWSESCGTNVDLQETTVLMDEDKKPEERSMRSESSSFELSSFNPPALLSGDENSCTVENFNNIGSEKISERHMSCDSTAKDSGIGDASNSTTFQQQCETNSEIQTSADEDYEEANALKSRLQLNGIVESDVEYIGNDNDEDEDVDEDDDDDDDDEDDDDDDEEDDDDEDEDLRSVAELLPPNTFFRLNTYKYIFPGAEVYMDEADNKSDDPDKDTDNTDSGLATASENRNSNDSVELLQFRDDANSTNANTDEPDNWPKLSTPDNLQSKSIRKTTDLNSEEDGETPKKRLRIDDDEENSNSFTVVKSIQ